jgi:cysteine synthase A
VLGSSSGINVAGAVRMARALGPGHVIVTMLCDSGTRYASRLFNPGFLRARGLPVPPWLGGPRPPLPEGALLPEPPAGEPGRS